MKRILLAGGGSGGHIMPLLAVKESLEEKGEFKFLLLGDKLSNLESIEYKNILAAKWRRYFSFKNFLDLLKIPLGFFQAFWHILWFMPQVCFSKGGYASVPAVIICKLFFIPIIIHESDSIPGKSNKFLSKFAKKICIAYKGAFDGEKVILTGNPVRKNVIVVQEIKTERPVILVLGGSQGSKFINEMIIAILPKLIDRYEVVHQVGRGNLTKIKFPYYQQIEFIKDMGRAYARADLVVTRGGANILAEISANKKAAIIIPLANSAQNHQVKNAYVYAKNQAASVFEESTLGPLTLYKDIVSYLDFPERAKNMGQHAYEINPIDASSRIAEVILQYV